MKLVFDEPGSDLARELWDRADSVVSSQLIYPEARAAVAAAHRGGRIDTGALRHAVSVIDELSRELLVIGLDQPLAQAAGNLAEAHGLRGYDAVHLASALRLESKSSLVATWDTTLARGAAAAGCRVAPPPR